tara:strand:+ start:411 stop:1130 length:720 start_codon:yes stop_codon:yes gene_type:complete
MAKAKDIYVAPIKAADANRIIKRLHYSKSHTQNSQLHLGVFLDGRLEGAMQFGPSIDKRKMLGIVEGAKWNDFIELNRMAFSEKLPRNSESRAIGVAIRIFRKQYSHIKWIVSFADGTQCGDGTIYRASGFVLTGIKKNTTMLRMPDGSIVADKTLNDHVTKKSGWWKKHGAKALAGFQLRYIYFLDKSAKANLAVPILPFDKIDQMKARMYLGKAREKQAMGVVQTLQRRGSTDLHAP